MHIDPIKLSSVGSRIADTDAAVSAEKDGKTFGQFLSQALSDVNTMQNDANEASVDLAAGKIQDISQVVIATEKANIALQLTMQIRNKVVDAYQEIMRMPM